MTMFPPIVLLQISLLKDDRQDLIRITSSSIIIMGIKQHIFMQKQAQRQILRLCCVKENHLHSLSSYVRKP